MSKNRPQLLVVIFTIFGLLSFILSDNIIKVILKDAIKI